MYTMSTKPQGIVTFSSFGSNCKEWMDNTTIGFLSIQESTMSFCFLCIRRNKVPLFMHNPPQFMFKIIFITIVIWSQIFDNKVCSIWPHIFADCKINLRWECPPKFIHHTTMKPIPKVLLVLGRPWNQLKMPKLWEHDEVIVIQQMPWSLGFGH